MISESQTDSPWMMVAVRPAGRRVVVVGSGMIARRRAEQFASRGALVEVYDPNLDSPGPEDFPAGCRFFPRELEETDLENTWLVVVATDDAEINSRVGHWAVIHGVECNRTDNAEAGTVAVPALLEDEAGWKLAVLGGQAGPMFSAWIKGLVGQLVSQEQVTAVYKAMAAARTASAELALGQKDRAFLLRRAMARILEHAHQNTAGETIDGAAIINELARRQ